MLKTKVAARPSVESRFLGSFVGGRLGDIFGTQFGGLSMETVTQTDTLDAASQHPNISSGSYVWDLMSSAANRLIEFGPTQFLPDLSDDWQSAAKAHGADYQANDNAFAARMIPFGLWWSSTDFASRDSVEDQFERMIFSVSHIGQAQPASVLGAYAIAHMIAGCVGDSGGPLVLQSLIAQLMFMENDLRGLEELLYSDKRTQDVADLKGSIADVRDMLAHPGPIALDEVATVFGTTSRVSDSVGLCLAMMMRNHDDFQQAIFDTLEVGGSTQVNATIVGALVGAHVGLEGINIPCPGIIGEEAAKAEALARELFACHPIN
jgi:hypothetical protein